MSPGCTTQEVEARKQMLLRTHPLHCKRDEVPKATAMPIEQAIAILEEAKEQYAQRLAEIETELRILRDQI